MSDSTTPWTVAHQGFSVHGIAQSLEVAISSSSVSPCRQILYYLSHQGSRMCFSMVGRSDVEYTMNVFPFYSLFHIVIVNSSSINIIILCYANQSSIIRLSCLMVMDLLVKSFTSHYPHSVLFLRICHQTKSIAFCFKENTMLMSL